MESIKVNERIVSQAEPEGLNLNLLKAKLIKNWQWFAALCGMGLIIAFVLTKAALPTYKISTTILIKKDARAIDLNNVFRQLAVSKVNSDIQDQVGVLQSFNLNLRVVQYFNWRYSWYKKEFLAERDLYMNEPYELELPEDFTQLEGLPLTITPVSKSKYLVKCKGKATINGSQVEIDFEQEGTLGQPFKSKYFQFTLKEKPNRTIEEDDKFILVFNNLSKTALAYKQKLKVAAANIEYSNMITVELVTKQLARDVDYLNQLGKMYIQFGLEEKNKVANNTIKFIEDQIAGVNTSLQSAGDRFSTFRTKNKTVDLGQEASTVVERLKQIEAERINIDLKLEYYNNLKFYLENRDSNKDLVAPSISLQSDDNINVMVRKLNDLYSRREVLSYSVQEKNPVLISLNNEISFTQKSLSESIDILITNTKLEQQALNERQQKVNADLSKLPKTEQDMIGIKRNFDLNNELYTFLLQRRAEAEITKASNNPDAQILDPTDKDIAILQGPIPVINLFLGLFGGFFIALCIVVVKELMSETLTDVSDISRQLDVSVVGTISVNKYETEMPVLEFPRSALAESFRGLRVNLEYLFKDTGKVLAIHSHISGEGKSFVAVNTALIFTMSNKKVLLVDGDLRKPRLHKILGIEPKEGLTNYLNGEADLSKLIQTTEIPNLSFVASGETHHNSVELLSTDRLKQFIQAVRQNYDFIIFDNAPIGVVYDAALIGEQADYNLILLRLNYSKRNEIGEINRIGHNGILKKVMVAVNGIKQSKSYGYYTEGSKQKKKATLG